MMDWYMYYVEVKVLEIDELGYVNNVVYLMWF